MGRALHENQATGYACAFGIISNISGGAPQRGRGQELAQREEDKLDQIRKAGYGTG